MKIIKVVKDLFSRPVNEYFRNKSIVRFNCFFENYFVLLTKRGKESKEISE